MWRKKGGKVTLNVSRQVGQSALNYLQVRAAGNDANSQGTSYDQLERLRINLALSGPIAQALNKCLEMVQFVDLASQEKFYTQRLAALANTMPAVPNLVNHKWKHRKSNYFMFSFNIFSFHVKVHNLNVYFFSHLIH